MNSLLGRYVPYDSFLHRMDPRAKLFAVIILMIPVFMGYPSFSMSFVMAGISFALFLFLCIAGHISFLSLLKSIASLWLMAILLLIFYCLTPYSDGQILFYIGTLPIYLESILSAVRIFLRLFLLIELTMVLTSTTKPMDLTYAMEWYLKPFSYIGFPSAEIAMATSLALRFIPTILEDVGRIMRSQQSRGVDFRHGRISVRLRAIASLIVPLFVSAFSRSYELADALACRGYDPKGKRSRYRVLRFTLMDAFKLLVAIVYVGAAMYLSLANVDLFALGGLDVI